MNKEDAARVDNGIGRPSAGSTASTDKADSVMCEKCHDTGSYGVESVARGPDWEAKGYSTMLCDCRKHLEPRDGHARWWTSEQVLAIDVGIPIFDEQFCITVDSEVPVSEDNYPLLRRGNRYYPTLIHIETPKDLTLHSDTARNMARALLQAADAVDRIDDSCLDTCGHWFPCESCKEPPSVDAVDPQVASTGTPTTRAKDDLTDLQNVNEMGTGNIK